MAKGIFVTGTDTGVGKTVVTRALVRAFVRRALNVGAVKPVESGADRVGGKIVPPDAAALRKASGKAWRLDAAYAFAFPDPVSPHLAAFRAGETIAADPILDLIERQASESDLVIAEGAGGLLVPLSPSLLYADVIAASGFCLVIVAPNLLGAINHTLLTLEAARSRKIDVAGVILNRTPKADFGNAEAIRHHGRVCILGEFPTFETDDDDVLASLAEAHLNLDHLLEAVGRDR